MLLLMDGELVISPLLEPATDDDITGDDETTIELWEDNADVLSSIASLELLLIDGELVISPLLEPATEDDITGDEETKIELWEDSANVLSSIT